MITVDCGISAIEEIAYANELGHNSTSGGFGGFSIGANSTVDQHILILERFVRF